MTDLDHSRRYRNAETGEYVSADYAAANPTTTTSEAVVVEQHADPERMRLASNLAAMLTEQLGVPFTAIEGVSGDDHATDDSVAPALDGWVAMRVETATMIHQEGRKLVAR